MRQRSIAVDKNKQQCYYLVMTLDEYLQLPGVTQSALAKAAGVTPSMVGQWMRRERPVSARKAIDIEKATHGQVTREELRPDIFGEDAA